MPALKLFGRKWLAATDDMVFPCLFELLVRVIWIIFMGCITNRYYNYTFVCSAGGECVRVYLIGMLALLSLNIILLVAIINRSAQGGICDIQARRAVPPLLGCKILLLIPEAGWNGLGTVWAFTSVIQCPAEDHFVNTAIDVLVCLDWLLFALLVFALAMVIDPIGSVKLRASQPDLNYDSLKNRQVTRTWVRRFRWFFCWLNRDKESVEAFAQVAGLFSSLFRDSDLVPSDLIAGCVLLRVKQKRESREQWRLELLAEQRLKYKTDLREVFRGRPGWISFDNAIHYMKLAIATYSCAFVMYQHCCTGICRLMKHAKCCACFRAKRVIVNGDNCCMCSMAGFKHLSEVSEDDCIYCNFKNRIFEVPFCVISDHKTKSIVVAVRGSISLKDVFTDLVAVAEKIDIEGLPEGSMAHKGMLITAKKLKHHLDETKTLEKALSLYPNYDLVFTGHSLGAAAAVLLGLLYRPTYPDLRVYSFATPCVLTKPAAVYCESFVFTLGVGDDFAMRASVDKIETLRTQLFEVLQNSRLPKYRVIVNGFGYALFGVPSRHLNTTWRDNRPVPHHSVLLPAPNAIPYMFAEVANRKCSNVSLYPAGNILHIVHRKKNKEEKSSLSRWICCRCLFCCCKKKRPEDKTYEMRWVSPDFFDEMRVMPRMLLDHLPENVYKVLETIQDEQETEIGEDVQYIM
ncbi:diacylglycerol lipase-beta-like isoform X2 [Macrosteles quadrilineatus]|uniref:diacylglycerol lipase-beta-like isoform X2 n=1 Tax=Macrosteles quadrilineatus TaxID=74068 RepID=UPI0023E149EF|nr:diacylglycerol lipase-beta-like isoform X2 [Macrosteles quadrilineatus]